MRARGQGALTLVLMGVLVLGMFTFDRLGPREPASAGPGSAASGAWFCPHGGGPGWEASLYLANPGEGDVTARVTSIGGKGAEDPETVRVPAAGEVRLSAPAGERGSSSYVEFFGGWIAAGWVTRGASGEGGIGAEPCAPSAGRSWFSAGISASQGQQGYLVAMNPFATDAVFDVAILATDRQPIRDSKLTDITLDPGTSIAIDVSRVAEGEEALSVDLEASSGRVAAATTVVSDAGGITSVLASRAPVRRAFLPTIAGAGQSVLSLGVPTSGGSDVNALLLGEESPHPVPDLAAKALEPTSAAIFPVVTERAAAVDVSVQEGDPVVAALRTRGTGRDDGATQGAAAPATAWVVTPTIAGDPAKPGLLILNPGDVAVSITLRTLPRKGVPGQETTLQVPPASMVSAPGGFLADAADASVQVVADGGPVVALGASTSLGSHAESVFGMAVGMPMPITNSGS